MVLCACAVVAAQDLSKPITYRTVAIPLQSALDGISKQTGITLDASDDLANEPVVLVLNGASTKDTMDHIASTLGGEWEKLSDKEFLLRRTDEIERKLEKEAVDRREANIQKALDRLFKASETDQSPEEFYKQTAQAVSAGFKLLDQQNNTRTLNEFASRYPAYRAMISLLKLIPPRWFAELRPGQKVVLSTAPNSMQQPLPDGADDIIDQFQRDQNLLADAFAKEHPEPLPPDVQRRYGSRFAELKSRPAKVLLFVQGSQFLAGFPTLNFMVVGANGTAVGDARESLTVDSHKMTSAQRQAVVAKSQGDPEIPCSPESEMFTAVAKAWSGRVGDPPELTKDQQQILMNPTVHDPLSFLVSDGFLALADSNKTNLVACPADNLFFINYQKWEQGSFKLATFLEDVREDGTDVSVANSWTTARCYDLIDEQKARTNRQALGDCLTEACSNGHISISSAERLALSEDAERAADLPWTYSLFGDKYEPYRVGDKMLLRFFGLFVRFADQRDGLWGASGKRTDQRSMASAGANRLSRITRNGWAPAR